MIILCTVDICRIDLLGHVIDITEFKAKSLRSSNHRIAACISKVTAVVLTLNE